MIFVTVGGQMPFDRLVAAVDAWAAGHAGEPVIAQIGRSDLRPRHLEYCPFLDPPAFRRCVAEARAVVAHAGMGTILTALDHGKPLLVLARRGPLGETRNDHQVETARRFAEAGKVVLAESEHELAAGLERLRTFTPVGSTGESLQRLRERVARFASGGR